MYATGDLVKKSKDERDFIFIGRRDSQVKLSGHRVELGEVEACLESHPCVVQCVVVLHEEISLVAFLVPRDHANQSGSLEAELRMFACQRLEGHKIPSKFVFQEALPLTASGKVDRKQLQSGLSKAPEGETGHATSVDGIAEDVRAVLASVLEEEIDVDTDFIKHGLVSRLIMQAHARLQQRFPELKVSDFFDYRTCAQLASELARREPPQPGPLPGGLHCLQTPSPTQRGCVTGLAVRAGMSPDLATFWQNLTDGKDCITEFTPEQLRAMGVPEDEYSLTNYVSCKGVIEDFACFDFGYFRMSSQDAQELSPLHRCFMESSVHALEDGGEVHLRPAGRTAVVAGMGDHGYLAGSFTSAESLRIQLATSKDFLANRVAYALNFSGPALNIQTACSTGLVAVVQAMNLLLTGHCEQALAGAVSLSPLTPGYVAGDGLQFSPLGGRSRCRAFSRDADGIVVGTLALLTSWKDCRGYLGLFMFGVGTSSLLQFGMLKYCRVPFKLLGRLQVKEWVQCC